MTDKKRKRRTFWEPDAPVIQEWLANQKDLGMSLQLIIGDAIKNYGTDDVIQTHLLARAGQPATPPERLAQQALQQAPQQFTPQPPRQPEPQPQAQPTPVQPAQFNPTPPAPQAQPQAQPFAGEEVNPIDILFADAGSKQR